MKNHFILLILLAVLSQVTKAITSSHHVHKIHEKLKRSSGANGVYRKQNVSFRTGQKKTQLEYVQTKDDIKGKPGMSAIVVIGNRTHRVSGPVVKQLLSELQREQNEDELLKQKKLDGTNAEIGQSGASPNLRRLYAANEVAEINKLLGKPLTDAKALGLIKNLLLDKVHTHLAKTMDQSLAELPPSNPAPATVVKEGVHGEDLQQQIHKQQSAQAPVCRDLDSKEKCQYLKDLGLCTEGNSHPTIRKRCMATCSMCDPNQLCADCNSACAGCSLPAAAPPPPPPPPPPYYAPPPPPPPPPPPVPPPYYAPTSTSIPCEPDCGGGHSTTCPESCEPVHEHEHHTTMQPIFRHTTPHPVVVVDNTPLPGHGPHLPNATPTSHLHSTGFPTTFPPECADPPLNVLNRPSICPPLRKTPATPATPATPDILPNAHSTMLPATTAAAAAVLNAARVTTNIPLRTTMLPLRTTIKQSQLTTPIPGHLNPTMIPLAAEVLRKPMLPGSIAPVFGADGKCQLPMDIGIAIDTSAATVPHWQQIQQFTKALIDKFQMGGVSRIGVITYDTIAKVPVHLETYNDPNSLKQHVNKLVADPFGKRRTDAALDAAKDKFFSTGRPGVPKILFLLEHGRINGGDPSINWNQLLSEPSERLRDMGVNVFAIGATPIAPVDELKTISSSQDLSHVMPLQSYGQLQGTVPQLASKACRLAGLLGTSPRINGLSGCDINYAKIGCYNDDQNNPRPLSEMLMTDRNVRTGFSGNKIDWNNWNTYLPEFVCRCARATKKKGYNVFGVQFFGECWSGPTAEQTYMEDGEGDSDMCISLNYRKCEPTDSVCAGKQETNFVYTLDADAKRSVIPHGIKNGKSK